MGAAAMESICDEAARATGLDDFGDDWFLGPLAAWAEDLIHPQLNDFGRRFLRSLAVRDVERRLRVLDLLARHPEITDVPLPPVLYITGLERSGTTLLHNLLARHPDARALKRWELTQPLPPPEAASYADDPRIAAVQASADKLRGSPLERMHWVNADDPEECTWGFIDAVGILGQAPFMCMPQWAQFLLDEDPATAYRRYRQVVQILLWRNPVPPRGFLVLKAPQISAHLGSFAQVFPEAHFVVPHRDPFRCTVSLTAMGHSIIDPFCADNPLTDDGRRQRRVLTWMTPKLRAIQRFSAAQPDRITHLAYPDLVEDPVTSATRVFAAAVIPVDGRVATGISAFLETQRAGGRAAPPQHLPTMGYAEHELRAQPEVDPYCRQFGVRPEDHRLTGVHSARWT